MSKLNPPILENTLPAFAISNGTAYLTIPFQLNRGVASSDFEKIQLLIKSVQSNLDLYVGSISISSSDLSGVQGQIQKSFSSSDTFMPEVGQYYKIQIAFIGINEETDEEEIGFYSNVGIIKCIEQPVIFIKDREETTLNTYEYIGVYQTNDITEKAYSYRFNLYDENEKIIETSGVQLHNSENDTSSTESNDEWIITKVLEPDRIYQIGYQVTTINGYQCGEVRYQILEVETVEPNLYGQLSVKNNFENGYNTISLIGDNSSNFLSGAFILLRSSTEDDYASWIEICRYKLSRWDTNTTKIICKDYCLRQGHEYKYAVQAYNNNGFYSNKVENIEGPVLCDFEDSFLYDGEKQLKIRFNPKISSFKSTVLESKMDTLGGKYPFIFRNGVVEYKEFPISGLLSLLSDDNGDFFENFSEGNSQNRLKTPTERREISSPFGTLLTAENYRLEREYKMQALNWLTNGKPKLFRSPAEGNFIVRLMNTSLSPNDTLGRLLHTFSSTAYEIAEYSYPELKKYGFTVDSVVETRDLKIVSLNLSTLQIKDGNSVIQLEKDSDDWIALPNSACWASISAYPNVEFEYLLFNGNKNYQGNTNMTGIFNFPEDVLENTPLHKIKLLSESWGDDDNDAYLTFGYYHEPDTSFSYIKSINIKDKMVQQSGLGFSTNIIDNYKDIRLRLGEIYYLKVQQKFIETISEYDSTNQQYKLDDATVLKVWDKNSLYKYGDNHYIDGNNPPEIIKSSQYKYKAPTDSILIPINDENLFNFQINGENVINFDGRTDYSSGGEVTLNTLGRVEAYKGLNNVYKLCAGQGIIMDMVYQQKEILYTIEETNSSIQSYKNTWLSKKNNYEESLRDGSSLETQLTRKGAMDKSYNNYIQKLEYYLERELGDTKNAI